MNDTKKMNENADCLTDVIHPQDAKFSEDSGKTPEHIVSVFHHNLPRWVVYLLLVFVVIGTFGISIRYSGGEHAFGWNQNELIAAPKDPILGEHDLPSLTVLNRVLIQLQMNYVDPTRFDPVLMLAHALDDVQKYVPEILFIFDKPIDEKPTQVESIIGYEKRIYKLDDMKTLWELSLKLKAIFTFIDEQVAQDVDRKEIEYTAINGLLGTLDPHSLILSPDVYKSMSEGNRGKFGGLGIMVRMINGVLIVMDPMPGKPPAVKAGIQKGDQILTIDGIPTLNMNIQEAVDLLKGEPATTVELSIMRKGWNSPRNFKVVRDEIEIPSIESADLGNRVAYVKIKGFQSNSQADLREHLDSLREKMGGTIGGLILDLRGNPGGLLDQAVMIADDFVTEGTIVTTEGPSQNRKYRKPYEATKTETEPNYPIVVLLDSASASASEIVAGALKNLNRAIVLGDTSFGKGSVQVLYELPDGSALKLTIAQYLTPGDASIQSVGIVPDVKLIPMIAKPQHFDLYTQNWVRRESTLGSHLDNQKALKDLLPTYNLRYLSNKEELPEDDTEDESILTLEDIEKLIANEPKEELPQDNPQVKMAKEILIAAENAFERRKMLDKIQTKMKNMQQAEEQLLIEKLKTLNIDWTKGENPKNPQISLEITTDKPQNTITAGEKYTISATITNKSNAPLYRVVALSDSSYKRISDKELLFGRIDPGQSLTRTLDVNTNIAQRSRINNFDLHLFLDDNKAELENAFAKSSILITTLENPQPYFEMNYAILDDSGNGLLDDHENVTLRVWVANTGRGNAEKPLIFLKNKDNKLIKLKEARVETDALKPGDMRYHDFVFETLDISDQPVVLELHVYDKKSTQALIEKIAFNTSLVPEAQDKELTKLDTLMATGEHPVKLFSSPLSDAHSLTTLPEQLVIKTNAAFGNYYHVQSGEIQGWVIKTDLKETTQTELSPTPIQNTLTTIPRILFKNGLDLKTKESQFHLTAEVQGYADAKDYYIYTIHEVDHRAQAQKITYQKLSPKNAKIDTMIPLALGLNRIKIYARDVNNSEAEEIVSVYREP